MVASVCRPATNPLAMLSSFRHRRSSRWPFWLLLAAWFCANSPQAATYEVIVWLGEARHFSHQQRLTLEVATALGGEQARAAFFTATDSSEKPLAPPIPAEATLKKIELAVHDTSELLPPALRALARTERAILLPDSVRAAPPSEPPRIVG